MANPVPTECVEALYQVTGGDYEGVVARLRNNDRIAKFVTMFADDPSYQNLISNMESQNWEEAFRAAHTLKGVARDMGFIVVSENASEVCEALRANNPDLAKELLPALQEEYTRVAEAIAAFRQ
ncbi:Hpt domain-containing protein [Anaerotardibacter muris]|uniref:Hpt domain-containing protein n=1 Tax=Anaerotardibacter muris TaxID=2941505 RepID=UPI00203F6BF5|nr:Hpt domain-containing protein [Anaerotardibacter muris]